MSSGQPPFECKRCNICCQGKGGITFRPGQVPAAALCLDMTTEEFTEQFLARDGEVYQVLSGPDGKCLLLGEQGCRIHQAKPDICRRWPFFEALVNDAEAFEEAKGACPGINPRATHEEFKALARREGY